MTANDWINDRLEINSVYTGDMISKAVDDLVLNNHLDMSAILYDMSYFKFHSNTSNDPDITKFNMILLEVILLELLERDHSDVTDDYIDYIKERFLNEHSTVNTQVFMDQLTLSDLLYNVEKITNAFRSMPPVLFVGWSKGSALVAPAYTAVFIML